MQGRSVPLWPHSGLPSRRSRGSVFHDGFAKAFRHIGDALREKEGESTSARRSGGSDDDEGDEGRASIDSLQRTILGFLRRIADGHGISSTERTRVRSCLDRTLTCGAHFWTCSVTLLTSPYLSLRKTCCSWHSDALFCRPCCCFCFVVVIIIIIIITHVMCQ